MDQIEEKLMTKFLNNFKNPTFGRFSSWFGVKTFSIKKYSFFKQNLI